MAKQSPIYSAEHYRMKILTRGKAFQTELQQLYSEWAAHEVPVPVQGFDRVKDYYAWVDSWRAACIKAMDSKEATDAMKEVDDDSSLSSTERVWRRLEAWESCLPPTPHGAIDRLLKAGGLDPKNKEHHLFVTEYVFFGYRDFSKPFFTIHGKRNEATDEMEVFIKLEPHTKLEHIVAKWRWIDAHLKRLPGYQERNKPRKEFERDFEIYKTYQAIKSGMKGKRSEYPGLDVKTWQRLRERNKGKYRDLTLSQIRKSTAKIAALIDPTI